MSLIQRRYSRGSNQKRCCWLGDSIHVEFKKDSCTHKTNTAGYAGAPAQRGCALYAAEAPPSLVFLDQIGLF